jgi:hypothetical protein
VTGEKIHTSHPLLLGNARYNTTENLTGTMLEFGKYTLKYVPPGATPEDHSVAMTISSEANLHQMLEFFSSFLRAAGYEFDGKELCLEREAPDFGDVPDEWDMAAPSYWGGYTNYPIMN